MALLPTLVSYYKMEEASGTRADEVGGNNMSDNNTVTQTTGKIGYAASFASGTSEYLSSTSTGFPTGASARSINAWINIQTSPSDGQARAILMYGNTSNLAMFNFGIYLYLGVKYLALFGYALDYTEPWTYSTNTWYMVTVTFDGTTEKLYVNGSQIGTGFDGSTLNTASSSTAYIGCQAASAYFFDGYIDEVGVWSKALSTTEITSLYNGGSGLQYPFGESSGTAPVPQLLTLGVG